MAINNYSNKFITSTKESKKVFSVSGLGKEELRPLLNIIEIFYSNLFT